MKISIRYFSKSGNTKKLAEAIAEELQLEAKSIDVPITLETDILFLGTAIYGFQLSEEIKSFLNTLDEGVVKRIVVFSTSCMSKKARNLVSKQCENLNIPVDEKFYYCKGKYLMFNKGRPNLDDLKACKIFARGIMNGLNQE